MGLTNIMGIFSGSWAIHGVVGLEPTRPANLTAETAVPEPCRSTYVYNEDPPCGGGGGGRPYGKVPALQLLAGEVRSDAVPPINYVSLLPREMAPNASRPGNKSDSITHYLDQFAADIEEALSLRETRLEKAAERIEIVTSAEDGFLTDFELDATATEHVRDLKRALQLMRKIQSACPEGYEEFLGSFRRHRRALFESMQTIGVLAAALSSSAPVPKALVSIPDEIALVHCLCDLSHVLPSESIDLLMGWTRGMVPALLSSYERIRLSVEEDLAREEACGSDVDDLSRRRMTRAFEERLKNQGTPAVIEAAFAEGAYPGRLEKLGNLRREHEHCTAAQDLLSILQRLLDRIGP